MSQRYLQADLAADALGHHKMAFLSGPRQVGKTTLGKALLDSPQNYFSWDNPTFRRLWITDPVGALVDRGPGPVLLDEIHKDAQWKDRLKGLYDMRGDDVPILVTGSARLDIFRRGGDSLMGRYLPYRLHPFSVGERPQSVLPDALEFGAMPAHPWADLLRLGGFPEPLLDGSEARAKRWSRLRAERLLTEDVRDLRNVRDLQVLRLLTDLLPERVGSLLSINALREVLGISFATVRDWLAVLEELYHCFTIQPWDKRIARSIVSAPKLYLFDPLPIADLPARRENLMALHLLKACHYWTDLAHGEFELWFVRTKDGTEVDFLVTRDDKPWMLVECKSGDTSPAPALRRFAKELGTVHSIQVVDVDGYERVYAEDGVRVLSYERFLAGLV